MLRSILNRALAGGSRKTTPGATRRPTATGGGSANREIERGARSLFRGLGKKRRGI